MLKLEIEVKIMSTTINEAYQDMMDLAKRLDVCVAAKMNDSDVYVLPCESKKTIRTKAEVYGWPVPDWEDET